VGRQWHPSPAEGPANRSLWASSHIRKPVDFQQLTEAVHQLDLCWLLLSEAPPAGK
jgi:hypothetical protein